MATVLRSTLFNVLVLAALCSFAVLPAVAQDWSKLNKGKQTKLGLYMTPKQAQDHKTSHPNETLFVDVRTPEELVYLGTATSVDANVPYQFIDTAKWNDKKKSYGKRVNKAFVVQIDALAKKNGFGKGDTIILMCRSGSRSAKATNLLRAAGYSKVYNQVEGFEGDKAKSGASKGKRTVNGWKNAGLPWTYKLPKEVYRGP
jgi:rhodanese-related sulfurtransferase